MANTWSSTPVQGLVEKKAAVDGVDTGNLEWSTSEPTGWATSDAVLTWNEFDTEIANDGLNPTGLSCPTRSEMNTYKTLTEPVIDTCSATGGINQATCDFDTGDACESAEVEVYDGNDNFIQSRDVNTSPNTTGYSESFTLSPDNYYFKVIPYAADNQSGNQGDFCQTSEVTVISF